MNTSNLYDVSTTQYDGFGRAYLSTDNAGRAERTVYDSAGRVTHVISNYRGGSDYWYADGQGGDDFDRPKARDADVNRITKMQYNAAGQVIRRVALDPKADGNEAGQQADNQVTRYVYADELTDKGSSIPRNDLLRAVIYPDSDDTVVNGVLDDGADDTFDRFEYTYHADGSMASMTDPRGVVHEYTYDLLGRRTSDSATSLGRAGENVDGFVRRIGTAYDDLGRRSSVTSFGDSAGTTVRNQIAWSYDGFGNVTASQQAHDGAVTTGTPAVGDEWDYGVQNGEARYNRLAVMSYPNQREVRYGYGASGSVADVLSQVLSIGNGAGTDTYAEYAYLGQGPAVSVSYPTPGLGLDYDPDGDGTFAGWDELGRVVSHQWRDGSSAIVDGYEHTYDNAGNRITRDNALNDDLGEAYGYDGLDRLVDTDRDGLDFQSWTLDGVGNWAGFTDQGSTQTRTANNANEIGTIGGQLDWVDPLYDSAGNLTQLPRPGAPSTAFNATWDAWNRLVKVEDDFSPRATIAEYEYDGLNRRIQKTTDNGQLATDYFHNENWQVIEEVASSQLSVVSRTEYVWDVRYIDAPVVRFHDSNADGDLNDAGDNTLYYLNDANFNVTALVDESGDVVERYSYTAYGAVTIYDGDWQPVTGNQSAYGNELQYAGYRFDPETGLYQVRNRYYHVSLGKFVGRDPIGYDAGDLNLYGYVGQSPLDMVDPLGLAGESVVAAEGRVKGWAIQEYLRAQRIADLEVKVDRFNRRGTTHGRADAFFDTKYHEVGPGTVTGVPAKAGQLSAIHGSERGSLFLYQQAKAIPAAGSAVEFVELTLANAELLKQEIAAGKLAAEAVWPRCVELAEQGRILRTTVSETAAARAGRVFRNGQPVVLGAALKGAAQTSARAASARAARKFLSLGLVAQAGIEILMSPSVAQAAETDHEGAVRSFFHDLNSGRLPDQVPVEQLEERLDALIAHMELLPPVIKVRREPNRRLMNSMYYYVDMEKDPETGKMTKMDFRVTGQSHRERMVLEFDWFSAYGLLSKFYGGRL